MQPDQKQKNYSIPVLVAVVVVLVAAAIYGISRSGTGAVNPSDVGSTASNSLVPTKQAVTTKSTTATPTTKTTTTSTQTSASSIIVVNPKAGQPLSTGSYYLVTWKTKPFGSDQVAISLVDNNGKCVFCSLPAVVVPNNGTYTWFVPTQIALADYRSGPWTPNPSTLYRLMFQSYPLHSSNQGGVDVTAYSNQFHIVSASAN